MKFHLKFLILNVTVVAHLLGKNFRIQETNLFSFYVWKRLGIRLVQGNNAVFQEDFSVVTSYTRMFASPASNQLPTCKSGDTAAVSSLQDSRGAGRTRNLVFLQALQETKNATERFLVPKGSERVSLPLIQFTRFYAI